MPNQNTLGVVSTEVVADLSKLDSSLRAALSSANTAGQQIGSKISDGIKTGLGSSEPVMGYFENIRAHADVFKAAMENVATSLEKFRAPLNQLGGDLQSFGGKLSLSVTAPLVALGAASIKSSADMDSLFRGLTAVAGSAEGARRQFSELVEVAKLPGLGLEEAVQGSIRLQAFGFSSKEAKEALLSFGNAIATVGGGKAELDRVIVQLGQMAGAGKVLTQDLRPIIQTVPQVAEILKKSFGADVLSDPAAKFEALGLSAKDVVKVLVTELGKLPKVTGGLKNDMENFSDSMKQSLAKLGDSIGVIFGPALNMLAKSVSTAVDLFTSLPGPVQTAAIAIAGVAAAAGPTIFALGSMARATSDLIGLAARWAEWSRNAALAAEATREIATAGTAAQTAITTAGAAAQASTGAFGAMATAIGVASTAFTLLAAGFAAFTLGQWLEENVPAIHELSIRLVDLMKGNHDLVESEAQLKEANDGLKDSTERLAAKLREFGVDVTRLDNETLADYAARLRELATEQKNFTTIFSNTSGSLNTWSKGAQEVISKQAELTAKWKEAKAVLAELQERQQYTKLSSGELAAAQANLKSAYDALHPSVKAVTGSTGDLLNKQKELWDAHSRAQKAIDDLMKMQAQGKDVTVALRLANDDLNKSLDALAKVGQFIPPVFDAIAGRATDATNAMRNMFDVIGGGLPAVTALTKDMTSELVKAGDGFVRVIRGNTTVVEENGRQVVKVKDAHDALAQSISSVGSAAPSAVSGLAAIGAQAQQTAEQIQAAASAAKNFADMGGQAARDSERGFAPSSGFKASGGYTSAKGWDGASGGSGTFAPAGETWTPETQAGQIKYISGVGGAPMPMGGTASFNSLEVHVWSQDEIDAALAMVAAAKQVQEVMVLLANNGLIPTEAEAKKLVKQMSFTGQTISEVIEQWKQIGETQRTGLAAGEKLKTATDKTSDSVEDLRDQLWRLIDAGQGNTMAAWDLRTRIEALTGSYNTQANAAAAAGSSMKQASAAMYDASDLITTAVKNVATATAQARAYLAMDGGKTQSRESMQKELDALLPNWRDPFTRNRIEELRALLGLNNYSSGGSGTQARAYMDGGPTPYYGPTNTAPYTFIPTPTTPSMDFSPYQSGLGAQPLVINIPGGGSAALVGQQVTQVLRTQAGYV